jgi:DNA repair protein RadC
LADAQVRKEIASYQGDRRGAVLNLAQTRCTYPKARSARFSLLRPREAFDTPRDRLCHCGVEALSAEELIALVLQRGHRGQGGLETARKLARQLGSMSRLASAEPEELIALSGLTLDEAVALVSCFRLARFAARDSPPPSLKSAADIAAVAMREIGDATRERVIVLVCDPANHLRRVVRVSEGSVDRVVLPVREILHAVLRHDGRAFAVAHNHPSGDPTPGPEDVRATGRLRAAAGTIGVRFLDHIVVTGNEWRATTAGPRMLG